MRARFLLAGIAVTAFLATLVATGFPYSAPSAQIAPRTARAQIMPLPAPSVAVSATSPPNTQRDSATAGHEEAGLEVPQPPAPDPTALPSYESDQASRNGHAFGDARTR
jgi:hypothetical protein